MHCRRRFFFGKNDDPRIFMPCVCDALPQALFFGKNDVPGICMPCVCVMHCRRRFFFGKMRGIEGQGCCVGGSPKAIRKGAYPPTIKARWRVPSLHTPIFESIPKGGWPDGDRCEWNHYNEEKAPAAVHHTHTGHTNSRNVTFSELGSSRPLPVS